MKNTINDVYLNFGITAKKAQVLEVEASNAIMAYVVLFVLTDQTTNEEKRNLKRISEEVDRKTLGNLLRKIKGIVSFDEKAKDHIDQALKKRNYLIHEFYKHHNFAINSEEGRSEMLEELKGIGQKLDIAHNQLSVITELLTQLDKRTVMSPEEIEKLVEDGKKINI